MPQTHQCKLCAYCTRDRGGLREHVQRKHFLCLECDITYENQDEILLHLDEKHDFLQFCEVCGKSFFTGRELKKHNIKHHTVTDEPLPCTSCNFVAKTSFHLRIHINTVHNLGENEEVEDPEFEIESPPIKKAKLELNHFEPNEYDNKYDNEKFNGTTEQIKPNLKLRLT